jgi:hypothetical protein
VVEMLGPPNICTSSSCVVLCFTTCEVTPP